MLKETICYSLQCDGCNSILLDKAFETKDEIEEVMYVNLWKIIGDKHYCPRCYYEKNNDIIPKEKNKIGENGVSLSYNIVDLGLPSGTLWMDRNIGASSPTDFGLYFAWGETQGYSGDEVGKTVLPHWQYYRYANGGFYNLSKYCNKSEFGLDGYTDSLVTLQTTDDAAYQFTNGKCKMPTKEQIQELLDNTTYEWTTQDGVNGGLFTSKINGNSIFITAAGICGSQYALWVGQCGNLWSSSLCEGSPDFAWFLNFDAEEVDFNLNDRFCGHSVRGVVSNNK